MFNISSPFLRNDESDVKFSFVVILGVTSTVEILKCNIFLIHIILSGLLVRKLLCLHLPCALEG